jgi:hypothetical protein
MCGGAGEGRREANRALEKTRDVRDVMRMGCEGLKDGGGRGDCEERTILFEVSDVLAREASVPSYTFINIQRSLI